MATYEQDSEVYRWGIDFFHGEFFPNPSYSGSTTERDSSLNGNSYIRQDASATAHEYEEHTQASFFTHDLFDPYCSSGIKDGQEEMDDTKPSSSCSSPARNSYEEGYSLDVTDEFSAVDGEVGRRLNQMVPIPHVPKINGEIPSVDEATSDHQRLLERLQLYDLVERKVQGDGNCQFRALSDQLYRTPEHHEFVRQQIIAQLKYHPEIYEGYVPMVYGEYLKKLSKLGEWGDHVTLQAAADSISLWQTRRRRRRRSGGSSETSIEDEEFDFEVVNLHPSEHKNLYVIIHSRLPASSPRSHVRPSDSLFRSPNVVVCYIIYVIIGILQFI
ncbi:unnamed protein product [Musa textilis]